MLYVTIIALLGLFIASASASASEPFELRDVRLAESTLQAKAAASNQDYLLGTLDVDRLLWAFRKNAGLPVRGLPYSGSWEDPGCELRGHFVGHYLSALSYLVMGTGDAAAGERLELMVSELAKVQARLGGGYLSAFPAEHFDRVEHLKGVWAPYYVIHKIMLGLLDAHVMGGSAQALTMVTAMADYFHARTSKVIAEKGLDHWERSLETEFGGMNEVLYRLYRLTLQEQHRELAAWFDKPRWWKALVAGVDPLSYHHANTHLAQVVGFAERFNAVADPDAKTAVQNFFNILTTNYSFATGGSNSKEFWQTPQMMAEAVLQPEHSLETHEICTQYNVLKIARALFMWTGDVRYSDFYERALLNGILGVSRLTADQVLDAERDNLQAVQDLLHHTRHHHYHHHHHQGSLAQAAAQGQRQGAGGALAAPAHSNQEDDHLQAAADLVHRSHTQQQQQQQQQQGGGQRQLLAGIAALQHEVLGWSKAGGHQGGPVWVPAPHGGGLVLQGGLPLPPPVGHLHLHRAAAAARHHPAQLQAYSQSQEVSLLAEPSGELLAAATPSRQPGPYKEPWAREFNTKFQNYWGFNLRYMPNITGAVNQPGTPGSFLYLLPMGVAQSKRDNYHHWGYPEHSFWCCYGTAVESFAKLADSLYFWRPGQGIGQQAAEEAGQAEGGQAKTEELPQLLLNQYVSSSLAWRAAGIGLTVNATLYAPGPSLQAQLQLSALPPSQQAPGAALPPGGRLFSLALRIPAWAQPQPLGSSGHRLPAVVTVNGQAWEWGPAGAAEKQGSYLHLTR